MTDVASGHRRVTGLHRVLGLVLFLAVFTGFYTWVSWRVGANSDNASALLIARDIAEGNLRLEGWMLSAQSYLFSDNIWTAAVIAIFGFAPIIIHLMPAFFLALTAMFSVLLVLKARPGNVILLAPFLLVPTAFTTLMANEMAVHCGIYVAASASLYLAGYVPDRRFPLVIVPAAIAWGVVANSDELFLVIFVLPAILAALLHAVRAPTRRHLWLLAATAGSLVAYAVAGPIIDRVFLFDVPGVGSQGFAAPGVIAGNARLLVDSLKLHFAIGFSGGTVAAILSALRLLFLLALVGGFIVAAARAWRRSFVDTFLVFSTATTIAAFLFSTMPVDVMSARYLVFAILATIVLVARNVDLGRALRPAWVLLAVLALSNVHGIMLATSQSRPYAELARYLADNGLRQGYAGFWQSHVTSATGEVHVAPVWATTMVRPFYWLSNTSWYGPGRTFFMTSDAGEKAAAVAQFGPPRRVLRHGGMDILVWDEMPMPMMGFRGAGETGAVALGPHRRRTDGIATVGRRGVFLEEVAPILPKGRYRFTMEGIKRAGDAEIAIETAAGGLSIRQPIRTGSGRLADFTFVLTEMTRDVRVRIRVRRADDLVVRSYGVYRVGD